MKQPIDHDQNGFGRIIIIGIVLLVIIIVGLVGWRIMSQRSASSASSVAESTCLKLANDKDLCKFIANFTLSGLSYKQVSTSTDGTANGTTTMTILADSHGNSSISSVVGGQLTNYIIIDGVTYMKNQADDSWLKFAASDPSTPQIYYPAKNLKFKMGSTVSYKKLGSEACGNASCLKYQAVDSTATDAISYLWFNANTYRLQHLSAKDSSGLSTDVVFTYQPVTISAPTTSKDITTAH